MTRVAACPNCASPLRDGLRFCTQCGTAPHPAAPVAPAATPSPDPFVESPAESEFDPVPALGPHAPEPIARPSILGLLATPSPDAPEADAAAAEVESAAEPDRAEIEAEAPPAVLHRAPVTPASVSSVASVSSPSASVHPLGVPVISARKPLGPGANPTHIGRASTYITAPPAVSSSSVSADPADVARSAQPARVPSPPAAHSAPPASRTGSSASAPSHSAPAPSAPSTPTGSAPSAPLDRQPAGRSSSRRYAPPLARSTSATWALVTGLLPLLVSIFGNAVTTELGTQALEATASGVTSGAWAPVFVALSLVFVSNAALLTVCAITGVRGIRETSNGVTRGRPLAVSGLAAGAVNVVLLVAGLVISISGLSAVLA